MVADVITGSTSVRRNLSSTDILQPATSAISFLPILFFLNDHICRKVELFL